MRRRVLGVHGLVDGCRAEGIALALQLLQLRLALLQLRLALL